MTKMCRAAALALLSITSFAVHAQNAEWSEIATERAPGWYSLSEKAGVRVEGFFNQYAQALGLDPAYNTFQLISKKTDELGFTHYKYQQYYKGIAVEGSYFILHEKNKAVVSCNGDIVPDISASTKAALNEEQALAAALEYMGAESYMWEESQASEHYNHHDFKPAPALTIADKNYSGKGENYRLTWKMDVFASQPVQREYVFVDASQGDVLYALNRIHHTNDSGMAATRYSGVRPIVADSVAPNQWRLRQSVTGGGVETYNMETRTQFSSAVDFTDDDNYWDNANANEDEVAGDVHWGTESVYNYFYNEHGRDSYDDQGATLKSYVHYDQSYANAFWNGSWMTYGDGAGPVSPLTSLDVIGHELSHGVTEYSAGLIYQGESGALNESFSDIFGTAVEFAYDPVNADYTIGENFISSGIGLRSMEDPKAYNNPSTYMGQHWGVGMFIDHGYVHSNSGVQNYWFYLLSAGKSGTNDNGDDYNVKSIGVEKAADIAYRNLSVYLGPTSDYADARMGAIMAAEDLYGACSEEAIQTENAWYAVGVGKPTGHHDLELVSIELPQVDCSLSANEAVTVTIRNNSCSYTIPSGDTIDLSYTLNGSATANENLVLTQPLSAGAVTSYTFNSTADLSQINNHNLEASISYASDSMLYNNAIENYQVNNRSQQNTDLALLSIISPQSGCDLTNTTNLTLEMYFNGCDSLMPGHQVDFEYTVDGVSQNVSHTLNQKVYYGDTFIMTIPTGMDLNARGSYILDVSLNQTNDPNSQNDAVNYHRVTKPFDIVDQRLSFESYSYSDTVVERKGPMATLRRDINGSHGNRSFQFTGGNTIYYPKKIEEPTPGNVWSVNEEFGSEICSCVDAAGYSTLSLSFDLQQMYSELYQATLDEDYRYASSFRVKVNGQQVSPTYAPVTNSSDSFRSKTLDLSAYDGTEFELCFEARTLTRLSFNNLTRDGDIVNLDNVILTGAGLGLEENAQQAQLNVYPNPSKGAFTVVLPEGLTGKYQVSLTDISGKIIEQQEWKLNEELSQRSLHTQAAAGVYFLNIQNSSGFSASQKVVIH